MTLFRHLTWLVLFFSFLIQFGSASLFIWHNQTTIYQNNENQAQNTAEVIANTLSFTQPRADSASVDAQPDQPLQPIQNFTPLLRSITDPLIASGQYKSITILNDQQVLYTQELPLIIDVVPEWFEKRFGFSQKPAIVSRFIAGHEIQISVEMNQAKSTFGLYRTIKNAIQWVLIGMLATGVALFFALKNLLKPLAELEKHAKAISNHQFEHQIPMPQTRELQQVVHAMNHMSNKLNSLFHEQLEIIQQSRRLAYEDPLTQLPNAVAFENHIKLMSADTQNKKTGFVVMCRLAGLEGENKRSSRLQADNYIRRFAHLWQGAWQELHPEAYCARRNSSEFLTCIETDSYSTIQRSIQAIDTKYSQLKSQGEFGQLLKIHMSMHYFDSMNGYAKWTAICSTLEQNLQFAIDHQRLSVGPDSSAEIKKNTTSLAKKSDLNMTTQQWNTLLTQTIAEKNIILEFQPIQSLLYPAQITENTKTKIKSMRTSIAECFMRIPFEDTLLSGAEIWPMINQLQLTYAFDRLIIQMALAHLNDNPTQKLSLNICDATLDNPQFPQWLESTLKNYPDLVDCLSLDIRESFLSAPTAIQRLVELKNLGISLILDRVIANQNTIDQFVRLPIDALKMNIHFLRRSYTAGLNTQECHSTSDHHQHIFLTNLMALCRTCDVDIIADGVESQEDAELAKQLKSSAIQGFWVSPPLVSCKACLQWSAQSPGEDKAI